MSVDSLSGKPLGEVLRSMPLAPLEIRILLGYALQLTRTQLITQSERIITPAEAQRLSALFQRRIAGEPIAYIIGQREFYGLMFQVTPDVLIPRPETELLVDLALERLPPSGCLLDMGTGSGAIAVAIAHSRPDAKVNALDVSQAALVVARSNADRILADTGGAQVQFLQSDWYEELRASEQFDLIVANPPYIVAGDAHLSQGDLRFEPSSALTDHADGLSALHTIVAHAHSHLNAGGWLLMEHGYDQSQKVRNMLINNGFDQVQSWQDLAGHERVSGGKYGQ